MPGGKRRLKQLIVGYLQLGANGTELEKMMSGSVGFATPACDLVGDSADACIIAEVTIANLSSCAMIVGNVEDLSACLRFDNVIAGDGQASIVLRTNSASTNSGALDARTGVSGGTLRYIAFDPTA